MSSRAQPKFSFFTFAVFLTSTLIPQQGYGSSELSFSGKTHEDVKDFVFKYELVEMTEKTEDEMEMSLVSYREGQEFDFYLAMFKESRKSPPMESYTTMSSPINPRSTQKRRVMWKLSKTP